MKNAKKILALLTIIALMFGALPVVFAEAAGTGAADDNSAQSGGIAFSGADPMYLIDGKAVEAPAYYENADGVVMVPLRAIAEALGYTVQYDGTARSVYLNNSIALTIGSKDYTYARTTPITLAAAPELTGDRTFVPLAFFREVLNMNNAYFYEGQIVVDNDESMESAADSNELAEGNAAEDTQPLYDSTIEYGDPAVILDYGPPLMTYIRYPQMNNFADGVVAEWANNLYQSAKDQMAEMQKTDTSASGELNIQFDSYYVGGRYVGIVEKGMSMNSHLAHPIDVVQTFNLDLQSETVLENSDLIDPAQAGAVLTLLRGKILEQYPDASSSLSDMDETWLTNIAIGHDGLLVILDRGKYLPTYLGTLTFTLPYSELGQALPSGLKSSLASETAAVAFTPTAPAALPFEAGLTTPMALPLAYTAEADESTSADQTDDKIDPSKPMVALTFDDGPSKYTAKILDLLEKYDARATFCVIGNLAESRKDTILREVDLGCEVIGHSWDHRDMTKLSVSQIKAEILDTNEIIESITGVAPSMYRPPYGAVNNTMKQVSKDLGFSLINWSVDTLDWQSRNANAVYNAVMKDTKDRSIILCHDLYGSTADAMERVIPKLIAQGYQLVTVSELIKYSGGTFEAGKVYYNGN
ncbi:MAG: polysaccharide deacetylase family protein [Defluviitaleaceae bacterium]|nr:polysaccharide deacetylase family protein [Defluviitaleaceae bacterium]